SWMIGTYAFALRKFVCPVSPRIATSTLWMPCDRSARMRLLSSDVLPEVCVTLMPNSFENASKIFESAALMFVDVAIASVPSFCGAAIKLAGRPLVDAALVDPPEEPPLLLHPAASRAIHATAASDLTEVFISLLLA